LQYKILLHILQIIGLAHRVLATYNERRNDGSHQRLWVLLFCSNLYTANLKDVNTKHEEIKALLSPVEPEVTSHETPIPGEDGDLKEHDIEILHYGCSYHIR
jgi:hypothetical protein